MQSRKDRKMKNITAINSYTVSMQKVNGTFFRMQSRKAQVTNHVNA